LVELLVEKGFLVRAFVHYNSLGHCGWLEDSKCLDQIELVSGDVRDIDFVMSAVKGCTHIYHLAALIGIPYSYLSPLAYIQTNLVGTNNILHCARQFDCEQVLITSTSETYGSAQYVPIDEKHPLLAQSPYAASKIAADQMAIAYQRSFGLPVKLVRPFNTYGPRQSARAIIPTIIAQVLSERAEIKLGNLTPTRDFTFVKDTVAAFVKIAENDSLMGSVTNIGSQQEVSMGELVDRILALCDRQTPVLREAERKRPDGSEVTRLLCDNSRLRDQTGWQPTFSLDAGLQQTIDWLAANLHHFKPSHYSR